MKLSQWLAGFWRKTTERDMHDWITLIATVASLAIATSAFFLSQKDGAENDQKMAVALSTLSELARNTRAQNVSLQAQVDALSRQAQAAESQSRALGRSADAATAGSTAAQGQLEAMHDSIRPWLVAELRPYGPLTFYADRFASLPLEIKLTNIGKSPAFDVKAAFWTVRAFDKPLDLTKESRTACDKFRAFDTHAFDKVILPDESLGIGHYAAGIDRIGTPSVDAGDSFPLTVYGCADYTFRSGGQHHQSYFSYRLSRTWINDGVKVMSFDFPWGHPVRTEDILMNEGFVLPPREMN